MAGITACIAADMHGDEDSSPAHKSDNGGNEAREAGCGSRFAGENVEQRRFSDAAAPGVAEGAAVWPHSAAREIVLAPEGHDGQKLIRWVRFVKHSSGRHTREGAEERRRMQRRDG